MGVSASVNNTVNTVKNTVENSVRAIGASEANIDCKIKIGSITIGEQKNCTIVVKNICLAEANVTQLTVADLTTKIYNNLGTQEKAAAASALFSASLNNAVNYTETDIVNKVEQICNASAVADLSIDIVNITVTKCVSDTPLTMEFINSGSAVANCIQNLAVKLAAEAATNITNSQSGAFPLTTIILALGGFSVLLTVFYYIYLIISKYVKTADETILINKYVRNDWVGRRNSLLNVKQEE